MIYSVICTDTSPYVHWQSELLEYSWSRVNQAGELLRLVSCEAEEELPSHRHARVIRTRPSSVHPESGDQYIPYNRLFSFQQWLEEHNPEGTVLILDPDCVFRKPLDTEVPAGKPIGQNWLDFGVSDAFRGAIEDLTDVPVEALQPLTWPALINCKDLNRMIGRWIELTAGIRDRIGRWESDMFAFTVAAAELGLKFSLENTTAWTPWPDQKVEGAPLIHYCQKIMNGAGEPIWWKLDYIPWSRVSTGSANEAYCNDLLRIVDEHAEIRQYDEKINQDDTIFIAIASYCEPELVSTIQSCLQKARRPENLRFGICLQHDESDELTSSRCLDGFSQDSRLRYVKYPYTESRGGCWARNIAQQLYNEERYTLQIDAHSQMLESWDTHLIKMMENLPSEKPLITEFPPLYYFENGNTVYQYIDDLTQVNTAVAVKWNEDGGLHITQKVIAENRSFPRRTRFLSGAFVFTLGEWNQEVMQDPQHFYTGEEFALTIRSFTHGYDLFDPDHIVVWHRLHPEPNRKFWHDNESTKVGEFHNNALQRLRWLFQEDPDSQLGRYGLGTDRTLDDYYVYSGLDCKTYTVHPDASNGVPPNPVTLTQREEPAISVNSTEPEILDIRIHVRDVEPLELACEADNPIIRLLFSSLIDKQADPDSVIYLNIGEDQIQTIQFKKSNLLAIETDPPMSEAFFSELSSDTQTAQGPIHVESIEFRFDDDWKHWIWHNIHQRGCSRDVVFKELILNNFPWEAVRQELSYEPTIPLEHIRAISEQVRPNRDKLLIPGVRSISDKLEIYSLDGFLTGEECEQLIEQIETRKQPSTTSFEEKTPEVRTSQTCFFDREDEQCPLANEVTLRAAKLLGINPDYAEPLQGHHYLTEQEYKPHTDCFFPGTEQFDKYANDELGGQRTWSMLIYLTDLKEGGATEFAEIGLSIQPKRGKAVFWNNLLPSGAPNMATMHSGKPLKTGKKIVLSQWFRSIGRGEMFCRDPQEYIPAFTSSGFEKTLMPPSLFEELKDFLDLATRESMVGESAYNLRNTGSGVPSHIMDVQEALRQRIFDQLKPVCEKWSGKQLLPSAVYGIRRYGRGTSLDVHRDRPKTHIISAILNVAQKVDEDWPLVIEDHAYRLHQINMKPGDMLLYEGGRLPHGRPTPLNGDFYCNVFVHYRPVDYIPPELIT